MNESTQMLKEEIFKGTIYKVEGDRYKAKENTVLGIKINKT